MKNKLIALSILAALTVSSAVFAAPYRYGGGRPHYGYDNRYNHVLYEEMIPNGQYYSGFASKQYNKNNEVFAVRRIAVYQPVILNIHAITNGIGNIHHKLYDMDQNQIGKRIAPLGSGVDDESVIIGPGIYELKSDFYSLKRDGYCEYKVKADTEVIQANAPAEIYRIDYAHNITMGLPVINYMQYDRNYADKNQYYTFDLYNGKEIYFIANILKGSCSFEILDLDERVINRINVRNNRAESRMYLHPGKYYLRVCRYDKNGAAYKFRLE